MAEPAGGGTSTAPGAVVQPGGPTPAPVEPRLSLSVTEILVKKPHTRPRRAVLEVGTTATNFPRDAVLARSGPEIRLFDAARGGSEVPFTGNTLTISSSDLNAKRQFFVQAEDDSSGVNQTSLALSLVGGNSPPVGPPVSVSFTCVRLTLDVGEPRPAPGVAPPLLPQPPEIPPPASATPTDKWHGGRTVSAQNSQRSQRRAQLLIRPPKPSDFRGTLQLRQVELRPATQSVGNLDTKIQVFQQEVPAGGGETPFPNPMDVPTVLVSGGPLERWAEGKALGTQRRDTGFQLGLKNGDPDGDRVAFTVGMGTVIELASEVVVRKKPHNNTPQRHRVALRTDGPFTRKALVTRSSDSIRFFNAASGGLPIVFGGTPPGLNANLVPGAVGAGVEWFAEGVKKSTDPLDFELTVALEDGTSPLAGEPARRRMTCVEVTLDILEPRTSPGADPPALSEAQKINPGRFVQQRLSTQAHSRAIMVLNRPEPQVPVDFVLHRLGNQVDLFTTETPAAGQTALAVPHSVISSILPATGARFFVEGTNNLSTSRRDTGYRLEVVGLEPEGDRVVMTVFSTALTSNVAPFDTPVARVDIEGVLNGDRTSFDLTDLSAAQRLSLFRVRMDLPGVITSPPGVVLRSTRANGSLLEDHSLSLTHTTGDRFVSLPVLAIPEAIPRSDITFTSPPDIDVIRCQAGGQLELFAGAPISRAGNLRVPVRGRVVNYCTLTIQNSSPSPARDLRVANRMYAQCGIELRRTALPSVSNSALEDITILNNNCSIANQPRSTEEQALFNLGRTGANPCASNLIVYYVVTLSNSDRGCAAHPTGQPGASVADAASQYTMAHELGHVMGLPHVTGGAGAAVNLMIGGSAGNTGNLPSDNATVRLTRSQCNTVLASGFPTFVGG